MVKITNYAKNVAKSAGFAFIEATKDSYSNIAEFTDTNSELFRNAYEGIKNRKSVAKRIVGKFKESPVFEISSMYINNAIEDIKSGDFYNEARVADYETKYGGDLLNIGDFELPDLGFNPDSLDDLNLNDGDLLISRSIVKSNKISANSISNAVIKGNQASIEASKEIASMFYTQNIEISKQISNTVGVVNTNVITGFKDMTAITKTMSEQQAKYFTESTDILKNIDKKLSNINDLFSPKSNTYNSYKNAPHSIDSVMSSSVDLKAYLNEIKTTGYKNALNQIPMIGSFLDPAFLKQMDSMMGGSMFRQGAANPIQGLMNSIVANAIPKGLKGAVEKLDASVGSFFPAFIGRMNTLANSNGFGKKNTITRMIGNLFGLNTGAGTTIGYKEVNNSAVAWDNMSKHYLEEVIPYYLRKMTAAVTGEKEMIFNTKMGKWQSIGTVRNDFKKDMEERYKRPFSSAFKDFNSGVASATKNLNFATRQEKEQFDKDYDAFKKYVYNRGDIDLKGKRARDLGMTSDRNLNILRQAMLEMDPHMVMELIAEIQSDKNQVTRKYSDIKPGTALYKLFTEGEDLNFVNKRVNTTTVDKHKEKIKTDTGINLLNLADDYNNTIFDYLRIINNNIEFFKTNGMITYPQGNFGGSYNGPTPPNNNNGGNISTSNIPTGYYDRARNSNVNLVSKTQTTADNQARDNREADSSYANRFNWLRRDVNSIVVDANTDMDVILATMQRTGQEARAEARRELYEDESILDILTNASERREKNKEKFDQLTSFKDKWATSNSIGEKVFLVKDKLQSWIDAPSQMMEKAVLAADRHLFDLLYKTSTQMTDDNGQPVQGFMGLLKYKAMESFNVVKDTMTDLFGKAKDKLQDTKFGKWISDLRDKMNANNESPINKFKTAFKSEFDKIKNSYGEAFGKLNDVFGVKDYVQKIKDKREQAAQEIKLTPEQIGKIISSTSTMTDAEIQTILSETQEQSELRLSAMSQDESERYKNIQDNVKNLEAAKKLHDKYVTVVNDPTASSTAKAAAQRKLGIINGYTEPSEKIKSIDPNADLNDELNRLFDTASKQNEINSAARNKRDLAEQIKTQRSIVDGSNGATYASEEERQQAIAMAKSNIVSISNQIRENEETIKKTVAELKSINEQRKFVEEQLAEATANSELINNLSINPFEAVFKAADQQRTAFKNELDKALQDLKDYQSRYQQYNDQAISLHNMLTDPSANYSQDQISTMTAQRDELTAKANDMRETFIPQAKVAYIRSQQRLNRVNSKFDTNINDTLKQFIIDSSVMNNLDRDRKEKYRKYDDQYSFYIDPDTGVEENDTSSPVYKDANGQYRSRAQRDIIKATRDKFANDLFSDEYASMIDPKTAEFLKNFIKNRNMISEYAARINDPELKAKFERAASGTFNYNEYGDIANEINAKYKDVRNAGFFAKGGRNNSSKPKISIMSPNEKIITKEGSVYTVPKTGVYSIPGKATVINPADNNTINKQAANERAYKNSLLSNAFANDGLSRIGDLTKVIGYNGLARGAIGGVAGLLLGNPLVGAGLGLGSSLITSNKLLNEALFGGIIDYDENGNPIRANDGLIKTNIQKAFPDMKTGAILGSALGLLGGPFGIIGSSMIGAGMGFLKNTQFAQDRLFGDGMILSEDNRKLIKKAFPNVAIGAGAGALLGPFGLLGGALLGGGAGFLTTTEKFKSALLGEKQQDGSRSGGIVGSLKDNLVEPLKNFGLDMLDEMKQNFKEDFLDPIKDSIAPITTELKNAFTFIPNLIADTFKTHISIPIANLMRDYIATPIKKLTMGITKKAVDLVRLPFKLVGKGIFGGLGSVAKTIGIKKGRAGSYMTAAERNEFRQRHKGRFVTGDKYAEFDKNLAQYSETASVDDLELIKNSIAYNVDGERGLNREMGQNSRDIGKKISDKFAARFGNAARSINRAIEKENYEKAFDLIRNTKTVDGTRMSKDEADQFISEVQELLKQRDELKAKKTTYKATDEQVAEYAAKLGIKKFNKKSAKQKRAIMDALKSEINSKNAANIKYGSIKEAQARAEDMQSDVYADNAVAVQASTNAFANFAEALKNVTTFMNGIDNFKNLEQNARYNDGKGQTVEMARDVQHIENVFDNNMAYRDRARELAGNADYMSYDRDLKRYRDTHVKKFLKFKYYSKITENKFPAIFDITAEDRVRLLNDMGSRGWFIDKECLNSFLELDETNANKVYNIARFSFTGKKKFVIKQELLDTICTLTKRETAKLGNHLSEENVYLLNTYKEDPTGLKKYIASLSNRKSRFREFKLKSNLETSNNGITRLIGRAGESIRTSFEPTHIGNIFSEDTAETVRNAVQNIDNMRTGDSVLYRIRRSNNKQDKRRDIIIKNISESRMFKNDPRYTPDALKAMTTDELVSIYKQIQINNMGMNAEADDGLTPINPETVEAGSKEEAELNDERSERKGLFKSIKDNIANIANFIIPKQKEERDETFFDKIKKGIGKVFGIGKLAIGVPLAIGAAQKYIVPFLKDKLVPWLVGEKDSSGNYQGGIASGVVNGVKNTVLPWITDTALPKVKSVLGELWTTGMTTLKEDILPTAMDYLMENLPEILEQSLVTAWNLIKTGAKSLATKASFGKNGNTKADTTIANKTRSNVGSSEVEKYAITSGKSKAMFTNDANLDAYTQNAGIGTDYINSNYAEEISNNEAFQSVRDKSVQETYADGYRGRTVFDVAGRTFLNNAAGMGKLGRGVNKVATTAFKLTSKVPGLGIVGKLGTGAMKALNTPAKAGQKFKAFVDKASGKAAANIAADVAENVTEDAVQVAATSVTNTGAKAKLLTKVTNFLRTVFTKLFANSKIVNKLAPLATKVGMTKKALAEKLSKTGSKLATACAKKLGLESVEVLAKILGKATVILAIAQAVIDFIAGWDNARNILGIVDDEVSTFERFFASLTNVISGLTASIIPADFIANVLLDTFGFLGSDFAKAIQQKQEDAKQAIDLYNAENGTDFETVEDFNRAINPTAWQKIKSSTKNWFNKAGNSIKNIFSKKDKSEDIATNAKANDGIDPFSVDNVDNTIDELLMNAKADSGLSPMTMFNQTHDISGDLLNSITGGKSISEQMTRYESMNKSIKTQIDDGKIKTNDPRYWEISTGGDTTFAASLYKLSEFMRRAISSPLAIIQDAINSVFSTEVNSVTSLSDSEVSATGNTQSNVHLSMSNVDTTKLTTNASTPKKKGKIATFFSNLFGKKSGKGSEFKNRKLKYAIPPKPLDNDQASFIKGQYSGGSNEHLYQRDYNDRFNISGDSNFQSIADSGCGPVVASEILARRGKKYDVRSAAASALKFKEKDGGTYPEFFNSYLGNNGVSTSNISTRSELRKRLKNGEEVVLMGQSGKGSTPFGSDNAHYVLATGMKNNDIIVQDPENPNSDAVYNANDTIKDSIYAISTGKGKTTNRKPVALGRRTKRSGTGAPLTAKQESNLYYILHEMIMSHESATAGGYSAVNADDCGSLSVGSIMFHANLAEEVLNDIAERVPDADDKAFLLRIAKKGSTSPISDSEAEQLSSILEKYDTVSHEVQDQHAFNMYKGFQMEHPMEMYNSGILDNPLSTIVPANIYNSGVHTGWADNWKPAHKGGKEEIADVTERMLTNSWWANSGSQYREGWCNAIRQSGEILQNIDLDNYKQGTILKGFSTTATVGGNSSTTSSSSTTTTDNSFVGKLSSYVKKALDKLYGTDFVQALFGGATTVSASEVSTSSSTSSGSVLGGEDYLNAVSENGADSWFLSTLENSTMSSGYRTSGRPDHAGIDYAAPTGTKIYSSVDGTVVFSGWNTGGYGNLVIIQDTHGFYHIFGHQNVTPKVSQGDEVYRGTYIGDVGDTGESFGSHLHYQVNNASDMWHGDVDPNTYDYSEYIARSKANLGSGSVPTSTDIMGPLQPSASGKTMTVQGLVKSAKAAANKSNSVQASKTPAKTAKCGTPKTAMGKTKQMSSEMTEKAITALSNVSKSVESKASKYNPGATSGSNKLHTGGASGFSNASNEILLAIVKLLTEISGNTAKLEDVIAAIAKISVSNATQLTGTSNSSTDTTTNSNKVMNDLSKALLSSGMNMSGLNALNTQFQSMNNSQIIDAVYKIARQ